MSFITRMEHGRQEMFFASGSIALLSLQAVLTNRYIRRVELVSIEVYSLFFPRDSQRACGFPQGSRVP